MVVKWCVNVCVATSVLLVIVLVGILIAYLYDDNLQAIWTMLWSADHVYNPEILHTNHCKSRTFICIISQVRNSLTSLTLCFCSFFRRYRYSCTKYVVYIFACIDSVVYHCAIISFSKIAFFILVSDFKWQSTGFLSFANAESKNILNLQLCPFWHAVLRRVLVGWQLRFFILVPATSFLVSKNPACVNTAATISKNQCWENRYNLK